MSDNSRVRVSIVGVVIVALFSVAPRAPVVPADGPRAAPCGPRRSRSSTRRIQTDSPRGRILDRNGVVLAQDRAAWAVTVDRDAEDEGPRAQVLGQLSEAARDPAERAARRVRQPAAVAAAAGGRRARRDARTSGSRFSNTATTTRASTSPSSPCAPIRPRCSTSIPRSQRRCSATSVEIDADQYKKLKQRGLPSRRPHRPRRRRGRVRVGVARHAAGRRPSQVDPDRQTGRAADQGADPGSVGDDVTLTIDANVQQAAETRSQQASTCARTQQDKDDQGQLRTFKAPAGAVVVLDAHDGSVVAMASNPAFPPSGWVSGISQARSQRPAAARCEQFPLLNRATEGQYAPGSAFKLVTVARRHALRRAGRRARTSTTTPAS